MTFFVKVNGKEGFIIGYGPGPKGEPRAIVVMDNKLKAVPLAEIELAKMPKKIRKQLAEMAEDDMFDGFDDPADHASA